MKKIGLVIIALCLCFCAFAQDEHESQFMRFYAPDCVDSPFPIPIDAYITISEQEQVFIKVHANFAYNAAEFSYFQKYAIPTNNNIYLRLDNGDIITLVCSLDKNVKDGFVTTENGIYQNYAGYSYFPIDIATIDKLRNHNIVKIRGQFKFEILDCSLQFTPDADIPKTKDTFIRAEQEARGKYSVAKSSKQKQETLKENPLYGF